MTDANDKSDDKHIDSNQVTSWSPCHVGRAFALSEAFGQSPGEVYGSDVGGHLDLLAKRERRGRISTGSPDPTTVHHNVLGVAAGCSDRCICETCKAMREHRRADPLCGCFSCGSYRRVRNNMNPIPW